METSAVFLGFLSFLILLLCTIRRWQYVVFLGVAELAWVVLMGFYAAISLSTFDLIFFFWAALLLIFAAVELSLGLLSFLLFSGHKED